MVQLLGETGTPGDPRTRRGRRLQQLCLRSLLFRISGCNAKATDDNGESKIGRLSKLPRQEGEETGQIQHEAKNLTAPKLPEAQNAEIEDEDCAPD